MGSFSTKFFTSHVHDDCNFKKFTIETEKGRSAIRALPQLMG